MATKKITDEVVSEEVVAKVEEKKDPWKTLVTVQIPRANDGDSNYLFVSLNNKNYKEHQFLLLKSALLPRINRTFFI